MNASSLKASGATRSDPPHSNLLLRLRFAFVSRGMVGKDSWLALKMGIGLGALYALVALLTVTFGTSSLHSPDTIAAALDIMMVQLIMLGPVACGIAVGASDVAAITYRFVRALPVEPWRYVRGKLIAALLSLIGIPIILTIHWAVRLNYPGASVIESVEEAQWVWYAWTILAILVTSVAAGTLMRLTLFGIISGNALLILGVSLSSPLESDEIPYLRIVLWMAFVFSVATAREAAESSAHRWRSLLVPRLSLPSTGGRPSVFWHLRAILPWAPMLAISVAVEGYLFGANLGFGISLPPMWVFCTLLAATAGVAAVPRAEVVAHRSVAGSLPFGNGAFFARRFGALLLYAMLLASIHALAQGGRPELPSLGGALAPIVVGPVLWISTLLVSYTYRQAIDSDSGAAILGWGTGAAWNIVLGFSALNEPYAHHWSAQALYLLLAVALPVAACWWACHGSYALRCTRGLARWLSAGSFVVVLFAWGAILFGIVPMEIAIIFGWASY